MTTSATVSAAVAVCSIAPVGICGRVARERINEAKDTYFSAVDAEMSSKVEYEAAKAKYEAVDAEMSSKVEYEAAKAKYETAIAVEIKACARYHATVSAYAAYASA